MSLSKLTSYLLYGLMIISVAIFAAYMFSAIDEGVFLGTSYLFFGIAAVSAVLFPVLFLILNPKKAKSSLVGIGSIGLVLLISYLLADSTIPEFIGSDKFNITESLAKMVDTSMISLYVLSGITIIAIIYTEVSKMFK